MAKFITYIPDPDLESEAIRAINAVGGELVVRGVSTEQLKEAEGVLNLILISARDLNFKGTQVVINKKMSQSEIIEKLQPNEKKRIEFNKGKSKLTAFVGLSGGVGTTSIAIEYAFESSRNRSVQLIDFSNSRPDVAIALGLHRIDTRLERLSTNLSISEGISKITDAEELVMDLGSDLSSELLDISDQIYVVTRLGFNTMNRLREMKINPTAVLFNFAERSKIQQGWRTHVLAEFPRVKCVNIPNDVRSFDLAAERKCALLEVASNSPARKSIATLAQCESM